MKNPKMMALVEPKIGEFAHVGAKIPLDIYEKANQVRLKNKHTWSGVVRAALTIYLHENGISTRANDDPRNF